MSLSLAADVAILGSGFAGSLAAMGLRRQGRTVVLLERGRHPRFAIGESSTPLANLLLEQLCDRYDLDTVRPLCKWGTWQRAHPGIPCGLKRGFSFFHHTAGRPFGDDESRARQLLVAASPHDAIADTHWYRPSFDAFLAGEAQRIGAAYVDECAIERFEDGPSGVRLTGSRTGDPIEVRARVVIDASGPRGFLHTQFRDEEAPLRWLPPTEGLYTHFEGVRRWNAVAPHAGERPPFPVDDAALHHVFPGGWIWVLRFNNGITSAGAALTAPLARELGAEDGAPAWGRLLARFPSIEAQFAEARAVTPFTHARRIAFRSRRVAGRFWAMLPSAAGVIDPLLSTGFPLTLLGVQRLLDLLERHWESPDALAAGLEAYEAVTVRELDATERLVAALYASMSDFALFKRLALLYFSAASFSETVWRLGRPERARGFLLSGDAAFAPELEACTDAAQAAPVGAGRDALLQRIDRAIAPFDVSGLGDFTRRWWYPVRADDLIAGASRLDATPADLHALLDRCGFAAEISTGDRHR